MFYNWLVVSTNLKNMKVSWDDDNPNIWKVIKAMSQTTNQFFFGFYMFLSFDIFLQIILPVRIAHLETPQLH